MVPLEDKVQGSVTFRTYYKYFIAGGGYVLNCILILFFLMAEVRGIDHDYVYSVPQESVVFRPPGQYCSVRLVPL